MANKKISELPYIGVPKLSGNTLVPLVTYFSGASGDTVHTYVSDLQSYIISGITGNTSVVGNYLPLSGGTVTGSTIFTNGLSATTVSATTYQNLPVSGLTGGSNINVSGSNGNYTISVTGITQGLTGEYLPLSGGTVTGNTTFTNGLTVNTISATTYQNLPLSATTYVSGGTYSAGTITFTNTSGGTFEVTGLTTGDTTTTITGATSVGTGLTIFESVVNRNIQINSITGDSLNKITTSLSSNTIEVGINEQNLTLWPLVVTGNRLIDGSVAYISGLTFSVSPLNYIVDVVVYNILSPTQVTLSSGDSTFDRIDVIYADISGNTGVLQGTPSSNPEKPTVDSNTQVEITFVSIPSNSTSPTISTKLIYDENVGQPTEWNFLSFGNQTFRISGSSTAQAYTGTKSISVSGLTTSGGSWSNGFILSATTPTDTNQYATLQFAIRNMSGNSTNTTIFIQFLGETGNVLSTNNIFVWGGGATSNYTPYNASNTSSWQLISIPLWRFYLSNTTVYGVRFSYQVGSTVARHYFDKIELVEGSASSPPTNSWTTIKGDGATTITSPNPNATLTISGGTNIGSFISGTSTVVLNLDNNINLNSLSATTVSATTYQNLPVSGLTGGSNINVSGSNGNYTISVTGITGGSTFTGGTVSGPTIFTSGLTATTVSATTYQNLPVSGLTAGSNINVSGSSGNFTISVTGITGGSTFTGGTVSGATNFTNGLTANTISATTYQNLPVSGLTAGSNINVSGSNGNYTISVTGLTQGLTGEYLPLSGGTVTGGTVFTSGVTANTISQTSYIDFTTGSTNPSAFAGRLFFDSGEEALTYYNVINNPVPIAIGQQLYTRVWNNTGVQIDKGKVIMITGTSNNLPSAVLATNNHSLGSPRPIGVAAENIPSGSEGLVINDGILSGITINTFSNGDTLYLSDTVPGGYVSSTSSLFFSARTNEIGYVIQTGTTTGKIYVNINNEDSNLTLTDIERNILEGNVISTGAYEYTGMTINSSTTVNVSPMRGWIVQNTYSFATLPDVTNLYYTGGTGITITNIATADATYVLVNSASTLYQQTTYPTPQQRRENIFLGKVVHPNRTSLLTVNNTVDYDVSPMSALRDLWSPIKLINQGVLPSFNTGLTFNTSLGSLYGNGIGWTTNQLNPNSVTISAKTSASFFYRTQTGGTSGLVSVIDPTKYDVNGVITSVGSVGSNDATNQRIYLYPTGVINVLYGQTIYATLTEAIANIDSETFVTYPNAETTAILIGVISVRNDIVDDSEPLTNTNYAKLTLVSKFGESFGGTGGLSTTTLQQAYNNSVNPEIVTNSTLGPLSVKNGEGTADNVTNVFEGVNSGGTTTSYVRADGAIYGSTISGVTISATTYQNLPVSGLTAGNNINVSDSSGNYTISVTGITGNYLPISGGTVTGNTIFTSGLTASTLNVTGNTNVRAFTGTTGYLSGSGQNVLTVIGSGNSTTSPLFSVQGSSGELFGINDSLIGSLFSVNDISGLPIVEVFSDNTTLWGSYQAPSLNTTTKVSLTAGTNTIYSIPTSAYTGAFYEYTLISSGSTGARAGQIMSIWSGSSINFTETSTTDIGTTAGVTFTVAVSGNNTVLSSSATTAGWTVKTIIRSI